MIREVKARNNNQFQPDWNTAETSFILRCFMKNRKSNIDRNKKHRYASELI